MPDVSASPIVQTEGLGKQVVGPEGALDLLQDINLDVSSGEAVAVIGASGSGKTTLLGILAGLDTPTAGRVRLDGQDLFSLDEDGRAEVRGRLIGFVFQSFQLLPSLTALENVMLPLELAGRGRAAREIASEVLARVGLSQRLRHYPKQLSGGEQQRVAIARAFATRPKLLLADEPTGNLDEATADKVLGQFLELVRGTGSAALVATHNERLAAKMDRVVRLHEGVLT